jgi:predicted dehydrogenase
MVIFKEEFILTEKNIDRKIKIGCIGVGQIGKHHLDNYSKIKDAEVVAVADVDEAELQRVADLYKVPHAYADFRELLQRDDIEAVDVCLHNNLHRRVTVAALEAGKHVYCEKPMAGSYLDAQVMHDKARDLGLNLSIQLRSLFDKEIKAARALVDQGMLGNLTMPDRPATAGEGDLMWMGTVQTLSSRKSTPQGERSMIWVCTILLKCCI